MRRTADFYDVTVVIRIRAHDDIDAECKIEELLADRDLFGEIRLIERVIS